MTWFPRYQKQTEPGQGVQWTQKTSLATVWLIVLFSTLRLISIWESSGSLFRIVVPKERVAAGDLYAEKVGNKRSKLAYLFETLQPIPLAVEQEAQQLLYSALSRRSLDQRQIAGNRQWVNLVDCHQSC